MHQAEQMVIQLVYWSLNNIHTRQRPFFFSGGVVNFLMLTATVNTTGACHLNFDNVR